MKKCNNVFDLIGNTPIVKLSKITKNLDIEIWAKLESVNPSGSIKDRIAKCMIEAAEKRGDLKPGMTIIVPTAGNTGISFAALGAYKGYKVVIIMPEKMSVERRKMLKVFGAEVILTPGWGSDISESVKYAKELVEKDPEKYYFFDQWSDEANVQAHYETTGPEIWEQMNGKLDAFVAGIGTGGSVLGTGKFLKEKYSEIKVVGVEPAESPTISMGLCGPHQIEGIGDGFVPEIVKRYRYLIDWIETVKSEDAIEMARKIAREEGLFVGISSGANVLAAINVGKKLGPGSVIVTLLPDSGSKYFSTKLVPEL
ncbi:MAG: cysteine synthase A [Candidatus Odinarchaeota archaeon]|nr:cysteine synthase A [Candidatus Odinarchaeota archaeon]